jgi:hypothetical protein
MMASKKAPGGGKRTARRGAQKSGTARYIAIGAVLVAVVVVAVVLLSGGNKQPPRPKADSEEAVARKRSRRRPSASSTRPASSRADRREERRREREERRARRKSESRTSERTTRYGRSGRSRSVSGVVQAIMTDGAGHRFALVDNRRLKTGDQVAGRRLVDIGSNMVKVEYKGSSYSVKVGQPLY